MIKFSIFSSYGSFMLFAYPKVYYDFFEKIYHFGFYILDFWPILRSVLVWCEVKV